MSTQPLQFVRHHPPYAEGEVAWFRPEKAAMLLKGGFAIAAERPAQPAPDSVAVQPTPAPVPSSAPPEQSSGEWLPENWREHSPLRQRGIAIRLGAPKDIAKEKVVAFLSAKEAERKTK